MATTENHEKPQKVDNPPTAAHLRDTPFLASGHLAGERVTMAIAEVFRAQLAGDVFPCLAFSGARRWMRLNRTNIECLKALFGIRTADWVGKRVTLCAEQVRSVDGGTTEGLRIYGSPDMTVEELPVSWRVHGPRPRTDRRVLYRTDGDAPA